jgi:hypothetical protein
MKEEGPLTSHINNLNSIFSRLVSVGIKFDDEVRVYCCYHLLQTVGPGSLLRFLVLRGPMSSLQGIRDLIMGEGVRRRNSGESSKGELLNVAKGRGNNKNSGSQGRSLSRTQKNMKC